jgi:hypothetical protein
MFQKFVCEVYNIIQEIQKMYKKLTNMKDINKNKTWTYKKDWKKQTNKKQETGNGKKSRHDVNTHVLVITV